MDQWDLSYINYYFILLQVIWIALSIPFPFKLMNETCPQSPCNASSVDLHITCSKEYTPFLSTSKKVITLRMTNISNWKFTWSKVKTLHECWGPISSILGSIFWGKVNVSSLPNFPHICDGFRSRKYQTYLNVLCNFMQDIIDLPCAKVTILCSSSKDDQFP